MSGPAYYRVETYDVRADGSACGSWSIRCAKVRLWRLRRVIRRLESRGYDLHTSIFIERHDALEIYKARLGKDAPCSPP